LLLYTGEYWVDYGIVRNAIDPYKVTNLPSIIYS